MSNEVIEKGNGIRKWTPYEIEFLVWICTRPWEEVIRHFPPSNVKDLVIRAFERYGLIDRQKINRESCFVATKRAEVLLDVICHCPLPQEKWVITGEQWASVMN